jgi:hypothetical protein
MNDRSQILLRLKRDIIGPRLGAFERIPERPSSRYLTGILFPQGSVIGQEDDDDIDQAEGGDDSSSDMEDKVSLFASLRPSTAGFSFAVIGNAGAGKVQVRVFCAKYDQEEEEVPAEGGSLTSPEVTPVDPESQEESRPIGGIEVEDGPEGALVSEEVGAKPNNDEGAERPADQETEQEFRRRRVWQRRPIEAAFEFSLSEGDDSDIDSDCGLECVWKIREAHGVFLVTIQFVNAVSEADLTGTEREEETLFQFRATAVCNDGAAFTPRPQVLKGRDEDQEIADLIYRDVHEFAVGHTASASWMALPGEIPKSIHLTWMPTAIVKQMDNRGDPIFAEFLSKAGGTLNALELAHQSDEIVSNTISAVCDAYSTWIDSQEALAGGLSDPRLKERANENIAICREASARMREGADRIIRNEDEAMRMFRLANWAMYVQFAWSRGASDAIRHLPESENIQDFQWRPFQLAFVLMCLSSSTDDEHKHRKVFDLIWFPTGGGKTEAYLFLAAYVLFDRRIKYGDDGAGVGVLMRYTLRTLTVQQFERATALITACELIRRKEGDLGSRSFTIGLWVGAGSTPNNFKQANLVIGDLDANSTPRQLTQCPVCQSTRLEWIADETVEEVYCRCAEETCIGRLPVMTVDSDIYESPPSLLIGTVDKFAQIVRNKKTGRLFGIGTSFRSPDLIIQDELHLISGPLGSMTGLYEVAIDRLCSSDGNPPKIVGSTATIRRASEQVKNIFDRAAFQFPPPAVDWTNSCFARLKEDDPGRLYVGVTTAGRSEKFALQGVAASLLQSGEITPGGDDEPYKTMVTYFNSLKTLGGAMVLMEDDALMTVTSIALSRREQARSNIQTPEELTSRKSSREIPQILKWLKARSSEPEFIDILLASNMLSVGVDIPRLGLMLMAGQPKSMSEYIQATSRVGRSYPGLVVTLYNNAKIRDRAHFEAFKNWHGALYRAVEPGSVTPFAPRARDKALHAPLVAIAMLRENIRAGSADERKLSAIADEVLARVRSVDPTEEAAAREELSEFISNWCDLAAAGQVSEYWNDHHYRTSLLMSAEQAAARRATGEFETIAQPTPNSLRNVEPSVTFEIKESARVFSEYQGRESEAGEGTGT